MEKMRNKRGQIRIQEMSFMIVGVIIFFVLVGLFGFSILYNSLSDAANEISETRTFSAITNIADSPEFSCGEPNCVDSDKVMALAGKKNYENFWDFSHLRILKSSGFNKSETEMIKCSLSNYPNCDLIEVYEGNIENYRAISSFVSLCRKEYENEYTYNKCEIAKLIAGYEVK